MKLITLNNPEVDNILTEYLEDKGVSKSQYVEHLIKKDKENKK